jgi:hypothetical protein
MGASLWSRLGRMERDFVDTMLMGMVSSAWGWCPKGRPLVDTIS